MCCEHPLHRAHNTLIHDENILRRGCELIDGPRPLTAKRSPKLIFVSIDAEKSILSLVNDEVKRYFKRLVAEVLGVLHPLGTIAVAVPRPWVPHANRIRGMFVQD